MRLRSCIRNTYVFTKVGPGGAISGHAFRRIPLQRYGPGSMGLLEAEPKVPQQSELCQALEDPYGTWGV